MTDMGRSENAGRARLLIDLATISSEYLRFRRALPDAEIHFAVKSLPEPRVLRALAELGSDFEVASGGEIELLHKAGLLRDSVIFSAPIKPRRDISHARELGIRRFVADSSEEIDKLAEAAPNCDVLLRLGVDLPGSLMPLSEKFGLTQDEAVKVAAYVAERELKLVGLAFHVGSQAENLAVWQDALEAVGKTMEKLAERQLFIEEVDIGGGIPAPYRHAVPSCEAVGEAVENARASLPYETRIIAEPGRCLVARAGDLHAEVIGTAQRGNVRWIYVNTGVYHGLAEANPGIGGISFPVEVTMSTSTGGEEFVPCTIAGYSCDGTDVICRGISLPAGLETGDEVVFRNTGAYTMSYVTNFCGIEGPTIEIANE